VPDEEVIAFDDRGLIFVVLGQANNEIRKQTRWVR
jgi:hypothetical protein